MASEASAHGCIAPQTLGKDHGIRNILLTSFLTMCWKQEAETTEWVMLPLIVPRVSTTFRGRASRQDQDQTLYPVGSILHFNQNSELCAQLCQLKAGAGDSVGLRSEPARHSRTRATFRTTRHGQPLPDNQGRSQIRVDCLVAVNRRFLCRCQFPWGWRGGQAVDSTQAVDQHITYCHSNAREPDALFWTMWAQHSRLHGHPHPVPMYTHTYDFKNLKIGAGERLRVLTALEEYQDLVPSSHVVARNPL